MIRRDLSSCGFLTDPEVVTRAARSLAASAHIAAVGSCQGTSLRDEIEMLDPAKFTLATHAAEAARADRFGSAAIDARTR